MIERQPWEWIPEENSNVPEISMKFGNFAASYVTLDSGKWCFGVYQYGDYNHGCSVSYWCEDIDDGKYKAEMVAFLMILERVIYGEDTRSWEQSLPEEFR